MKINKLIADASGLSEQESMRQKIEAVRQMLVAAGEEITADGIKMWVHRSSIPAAWFVKVIQAALAAGRRLEPAEYL
jgi:aspartokinase